MSLLKVPLIFLTEIARGARVVLGVPALVLLSPLCSILFKLSRIKGVYSMGSFGAQDLHLNKAWVFQNRNKEIVIG